MSSSIISAFLAQKVMGMSGDLCCIASSYQYLRLQKDSFVYLGLYVFENCLVCRNCCIPFLPCRSYSVKQHHKNDSSLTTTKWLRAVLLTFIFPVLLSYDTETEHSIPLCVHENHTSVMRGSKCLVNLPDISQKTYLSSQWSAGCPRNKPECRQRVVCPML